MFLNIDNKKKQSLAVIDDGGLSITYGELVGFCGDFYSCVKERTLIFILSENVAGSFAGYVAALSNKVVPLILDRHTEAELLLHLIELYKPQYLWMPSSQVDKFSYTPVYEKYNYSLVKTGFPPIALYEDLSLLLPTSGSTGSPKLVRHSYRNVEANAQNVATLFELTEEERAIVILPMHYTMGLSVIASHVYAGATLLLIKRNLIEKEFWSFVKEKKATSFTGVPFSYEILNKLRFFRMDLPDLKLITQGGGKLHSELFMTCAEYAANNHKKFIATYGQTEGTARMAYLPAEYALTKCGSIGKAIPNGEIYLIDNNGDVITDAHVSGEMIYKGENVTLGYAIRPEDLLLGDDRKGILPTGDIVYKDEDGFIYIVGRMSRFLKLYGFRVSLDESEQLLKSAFNGIECACVGTDKKMIIYITEEKFSKEIIPCLVQKIKIIATAFEVRVIKEIPKNEAGKIRYKELQTI